MRLGHAFGIIRVYAGRNFIPRIGFSDMGREGNDRSIDILPVLESIIKCITIRKRGICNARVHERGLIFAVTGLKRQRFQRSTTAVSADKLRPEEICRHAQFTSYLYNRISKRFNVLGKTAKNEKRTILGPIGQTCLGTGAGIRIRTIHTGLVSGNLRRVADDEFTGMQKILAGIALIGIMQRIIRSIHSANARLGNAIFEAKMFMTHFVHAGFSPDHAQNSQA